MMACRRCGAHLAADSRRLGYTLCAACEPRRPVTTCANGHDATRHVQANGTCARCARLRQHRHRIRGELGA